MVKRRGYRVELGEIEAALYRHAKIREAAVLAFADEEAGVRIVAFLSSHEAGPAGLIEMKRFCAENMPLYMIPDKFSWQPALPKTSTDKIDYQRLKEMGRWTFHRVKNRPTCATASSSSREPNSTRG